MTHWSWPRLFLTLAAWAIVWALVARACLSIGSTDARWTGHLHDFRVEMVLVASLVGAALGAAGVAYQSVLRNPLADPYLLGVSSGATLATFLWALPLGTAGAWIAQISQPAFALVGALLAVAIVLGVAQRRGRIEPITVLLAGVILNAILGAIYLFLYQLNLRWDQTTQTGGAFRFLVGGIQTNLTGPQEYAAGAGIAAGWIALMYLAGDLNVAPLSDAEALSLGVRIHRVRWAALLAGSLMTACAVSISGPIGFVGLICPHAARLLVGPDPRRLIPAATAFGAILLAVADSVSRYLSRAPFLGTQLPVGVLTGLLGGPFFLLLMWQRQQRRE
jgi:iron complex transport system permease protein